jgi:hypothetical protein
LEGNYANRYTINAFYVVISRIKTKIHWFLYYQKSLLFFKYVEKKFDGGFSFHNEKQEQVFSDKFYKERSKFLENILSDLEAKNIGTNSYELITTVFYIFNS